MVDAARYAIVGQTAQIVVRVDDLGGGKGGPTRVALRIDGSDAGALSVLLGRNTPISVPIAHEGESVVEIEAEPGPQELTLQNNRAVVAINGVRDRLRVLLISGEPNAGERVWRNLLKGDPSVDLVHFTILRPPEKQDETPLKELSLIVFPTQELFAEKLDGFDLVIFDRYSEHGILPLAYFENISAYVYNGGALLVSAGPEFAGPMSIYRTPLAAVLPAQPGGEIVTRPFKPVVTPDGLAHPVTRDLPGANTDKTPPRWGRWFRLIGAEKITGATVMSGNDKPLLVLDRIGKGRVAELLSDQGWLWARGFEGGGPEAELLRRLAHWLMKEPELEEERLTAAIAGGDIVIERRTMAAAAAPVTLTDPSGKQTSIALTKIRTRHLARPSESGRIGPLSRHRRQAFRRRGGGAAQSEGSRRHARQRCDPEAGGGTKRRFGALAGRRHARYPAHRTRPSHGGRRLDRNRRQQGLAGDQRRTNAAIARLGGAVASARNPDAGVAARGAVADFRPVGADRMGDIGAAYFARQRQQHVALQRLSEDARLIDRSRKADAPRRQRRESHAHIIRLVADQDDARVALGARFLDAPFHQRDADAAAALIGLHRQRPEQQGFLHADDDRPEADGTAQLFFLYSYETQPRDRVHAFAQPVCRLGEAAGAEARLVQRLHLRSVLRAFGPDLPCLVFCRHGALATVGARQKQGEGRKAITNMDFAAPIRRVPPGDDGRLGACRAAAIRDRQA